MIFLKGGKRGLVVFLLIVLLPVLASWSIGIFFNRFETPRSPGLLSLLILVPFLGILVAKGFAAYVRSRFKDVVESSELQLFVEILGLSFVSLTGNSTAILFLILGNLLWMASISLFVTLIGGLWVLRELSGP